MSGASSEAAALLPLIFTFIIVFAVKFIRNQIHEDSIKKELSPIFPDISSRNDHFSFKIHGLKAKLSFVAPTKYTVGSTTLKIIFPSGQKRNSLFESQVFTIEFESRGFFGTEYRKLSDLKRRITIRTDNEILKRNLSIQKGLLSALRDIYLTVKSNAISFTMTPHGVTLECGKYLRRGTEVKKVVVRAITALECSLKAAAQSNVTLAFDNPFDGHATKDADFSNDSDSISSYTSSYMDSSDDFSFNSMDEDDSSFYSDQENENAWGEKAGLSGGGQSDYSLGEGYDTRGYGDSENLRLTSGSDFSSGPSDALALATPDRQRLAMNSGRNDRLNKAPGENNYPPEDDIFEDDRIDEYSPKERVRERDIETERADEESRLYF